MQEEFRAIAALEHPQIARAYDFGYTERDGVPFYTREYVPGRPLPPGPPGSERPEDYLRPVLDLLEALDHAHARGILHLDIHAGNLILADDPARGGVLIDFGLAPTPRAIVRSAGAAGWAALPPELLAGQAPASAADIYFAGRLLFHRLTGRQGGAPSLPREISGWGARRTLELERIAQKALQPDPRQRFVSAAEMRAALAAAVGGATRPRARAEPGSELLGREAELARVDQPSARPSTRGRPCSASPPAPAPGRLGSWKKLACVRRSAASRPCACASPSRWDRRRASLERFSTWAAGERADPRG
jgi:serine/threonine-protein kinase